METFLQQLINGISLGAIYSLIALGYTMVYGVLKLINFAHGDLFMLGSCLALSILAFLLPDPAQASALTVVLTIGLMLVVCPVFCAVLNMAVDWAVYKPLRNAPKLAPLVSAIGVSFVFMNIGLFWIGPPDINFPDLVSSDNLFGAGAVIRFTYKDLLVVGVTVPLGM